MNDFDPLALVKKYLLEKKFEERTFQLITNKMSAVEKGIDGIEKLTSIDYPVFFIEPSLLIATSDIEYQQYSLVYARTIPFCTTENRIKIVIQLSAPLVMYGLKATLYAVLAHEFPPATVRRPRSTSGGSVLPSRGAASPRRGH